jgi:hypothetical protein
VSTATLERPASIKGEAQPSRKRLERAILAYRKAEGEIEEYQGRAERAVADEERALENADLTESEAAKQIAASQSLKAVYASRTASRQKALTGLFNELKSALEAANNESRGCIDVLVESRLETLRHRLIKAGGLDQSILVRREFQFVLEHAESIRCLRQMQIIWVSGLADTSTAAFHLAERIQKNFAVLETERDRTI